ncbi:MAG: type I secretion system permease/ATPase [Thioalkalispiraceae bacterium]|jgi:ATP-binding cassette subfamily C protein LapB
MSEPLQESQEHQWDPGDAEGAFYDPLLSALVLLTKMQNKPFSAQALKAGLPLVNNRFTPELFVRAAARAGMSAQIVKRPLTKITELVLPAVLLLDNEQACILLEIDAAENRARILEPETGKGEKQLGLEDLDRHYLGYAIFVRPEYQFGEQGGEVEYDRSQHWFWGTLSRSWRIYRDVLVASFLINMFALATPLFIMNVYDRVVPNNAFETLWVLAIGVIIIYGFDLIMRALRGYFIDVAGKKSDVTLSAMIFEKVMGLRMADRPHSVGAFANHLGEFESVRNFITSTTVLTLVDLPFIVLFLIVIGYIGGWAVIVPLACIPVLILYALLIQPSLHKAIDKTVHASAQKNAMLIESLVAAETVKTLAAESPLQRKWEQVASYIAKWGMRSRLLSSSAVNLAVFLQHLAMAGVILVGVYMISSGDMSMGGLIACVILTGRAMAPMAMVVNLATHFNQALTGLKNLDRIMKMPVEREDQHAFVHRSKLGGAIKFQNVSFKYPRQLTAALDNVSFRIDQGERVAIIGRTGSGKTTIEKLILGLYQPTSGAVYVDGIDVRQIDPADLRHNIGYVPQDVVLFSGSVRDNIVFGAPHADDDAVLRAADLAGVSEFVNQHPSGFDLSVGERGNELSGGQRQSVVVARSLLFDPPIMLMDEPTNSMDNSTEERLKKKLEPVLKDKTVLLVSHRASLLDLVDRIIIIDHGRIIADGPKEKVREALRQGKLRVTHD